MRQAGFAAALMAAVFVSACGGGGGGGGGSGGSGSTPNTPPVAEAGQDVTAAISPQGTALNGAASSDPDGGALTYAWTIQTQPAGAGATIANANLAGARLNAFAPGAYVLQLRVTDPRGASATDTVNVTLTNDAPVAALDISATMPAIGEEVLLDATGSSDVNGQPLSFTWTLIQSPPGSLVRDSFDGAVVPVQFDVEGDYAFRLEVTDGYDPVTEDSSAIMVTEFSIQALSAPFRYAATQPAGGRTVIAMNSTLIILDVDGNEEAIVTLPATALTLAVSPDGKLAAAGHANSVSFINMETRTLAVTHPVSVGVGTLVVGNDGTAHVFPPTDLWVRVASVNMPTGQEFVSEDTIFAGERARMHPSDLKAYVASTQLEPSSLQRVDLPGGAAVVSYFSKYHGDFPFCGDLWIATDGASILSKCGVVVTATDTQATDLTFKLKLQGLDGTIQHASYSQFTRYWYVVDGDDGAPVTSVKVFDSESGVLVETIDLPMSEGQSGAQLFVKFVVASQTANSVLILAQDHATNPQNYYTVRSTRPAPASLDLPPDVILQTYSAGSVGQQVTIDAGASFDPEGMPLAYAWTLVSQPELSAITPAGTDSAVIRFTPIVAGEYVFELVASDGNRQSAPKRVTVNVSGTPGVETYRMAGQIADMEYSPARNELAYIVESEAVLHLLDLDDYSERRVELPRRGNRVGVSPDGQFAAVSHSGLVSLVDLSSATVVDTQVYDSDWGDIVLDSSNRAHVIPNRDPFALFISIDFAADTVGEDRVNLAKANSQMRLHPNGFWVYTADRDYVPTNFAKWDISTFPSTYKDDSPYHGDYPIDGDIWISEDGDDLLVASGRLFNSSDDPSVDMTYLDRLADDVFVAWADHSAQTGLWAVGVQASLSDPSLNGTIVYYRDTDFSRDRVQALPDIPTGATSVPAAPQRVFLSQDAGTTIALVRNATLADGYAVEVISSP
ncbi:MAG: hypothetical protein KDA53_13095 [Hyphomonas sp.]|nr:hypothetical protein [Hyphomonas sp.]